MDGVTALYFFLLRLVAAPFRPQPGSLIFSRAGSLIIWGLLLLLLALLCWSGPK